MAKFLPLRQEAPMLVGILWMFQLLAFILVGLRLYTRLVVIHQYGMDDHFFNISVFCLLVYTILMTIATRYGLGQDGIDVFSSETTLALLLVNIGQTIIFIAVIAVKISIACFMLRIVGTFTGQQVAIVLPVAIMSIVVFISAWVMWFSCTPTSYVWDISLPGGYCDPGKQFWAALLPGVTVVLVELWYASFPWYLIRGLQMPKREKILIGTCMSVSYLSAACSIARLLHLLHMASEAQGDRFLRTIVEALIWHAADITTQLFCIGVTVCRPLYKDWLYRVADGMESDWNTGADTTKNSRYGAKKGPDAIALRSIGGHIIKSGTEGSGREQGRTSYSSRKANAALKRKLVFQKDAENTEFATLPPIATTSDSEKTMLPSATSSKY